MTKTMRQYWPGLSAILMMGILGCAPSAAPESTKILDEKDVRITRKDVISKRDADAASEPATADAAPAVAAMDAPKAAPAETSGSETSAGTSKPETPGAAPPTTVASSDYSGPAKFVGRIVVKGVGPKLPPLLAQGAQTKDLFCSETAVTNESVIISNDGGLANVFVFMKRAPRSGVPAAPAEPVVVDQVGCVFTPHAAIVRVGQPLLLKNSDPVAHNVRLNGLQSQFNETIGAGSAEGLTKVLDFPERLPAGVVCDFHNWMSAYLMPIDHPWAAVSDENGEFEIADLPDGEWEFVLWHEKALYVDRGYKVTAAVNKLVENVFEVDASVLSK